MIYMPRKAVFIILLLLGLICFVGGIVEKEPKTFLVGVGALIYSIVTLVRDWKKKQVAKKG